MSSTNKVTATPVVHYGILIPKGVVPIETLALVPQERVELRVLLANRVFQRAVEYAQLQRPSSLFSGNPTIEDQAIRLAEIRGWDSSLMAICLQAQTEVYQFPNHKAVKYSWTQPSGYEPTEII